MNRRSSPLPGSSITVICNFPLQFAAVKHIVSFYIRNKIDYQIVACDKLPEFYSYECSKASKFIAISSLWKQYRMRRLVYALVRRFFLILYSPLPFNGPRLNSSIAFLMNILCGETVRSREILNVTKSNLGWFIAGNKARIVTLTGSWDHPKKFHSSGYLTDVLLTWNSTLANEWSNRHGSDQYIRYPPSMFDYLIHKANPLPFSDDLTREYVQGSMKVMYMMTFTANYKYPHLFEEELLLVEELAAIFQASGHELLVKPKPEGGHDQLDFLQHKYKNVTIGKYFSTSLKDSVVLTDQYNDERISEISSCTFGINIGTTMAIDCALAGLPIVQLDVTNCQTTCLIAEWQRHSPFRRYFFSDLTLVHQLTSLSELWSTFDQQSIQETFQQSLAFSESVLRTWIPSFPNISLEREQAMRTLYSQDITNV